MEKVFCKDCVHCERYCNDEPHTWSNCLLTEHVVYDPVFGPSIEFKAAREVNKDCNCPNYKEKVTKKLAKWRGFLKETK